MIVLLSSSRPLSLREIGATVAGYPSEHGALRQAFERDKKTLRDGGIPVSVEPIGGEDQYGYRILPEQYYLPDLGLDTAEEAALAFAVAAVRLEGGLGDEAVAKLGLSEPLGQRPLALLPSLPALGTLHEAVRERSLAQFAYRGREREVEPYGLLFRAGGWYLVGRDRTAAPAGAVRTFRVDRLESPPALGPRRAFEPQSIDLGAELRLAPVVGTGRRGAGEAPLRAGEDGEAQAVRVVLEVDAREAPAVLAALGPHALEVRRSDGSARLACRVADEPAFARWVLRFGDAVEVTAPAELRTAVMTLLEQAASRATPPERSASHARHGASVAGDEPGDTATPGFPAAAAAGSSSNLDAGARLRRLLAVLAYLARVGEAPIAELAERFAITPAALVVELELAACCGLPPYTPDQLLELVVDEGSVRAFHLSALERPPRLTAEEGFAVAAAARALLAVRGAEADGPLASALSKLERALGASQIEVELERPELLEPLRQAAASGEMLDITYLSRAGCERERRVEPYAVVVRDGRWYLDAWCHLAGDWRRFLVERVARPASDRHAERGPHAAGCLCGRTRLRRRPEHATRRGRAAGAGSRAARSRGSRSRRAWRQRHDPRLGGRRRRGMVRTAAARGAGCDRDGARRAGKCAGEGRRGGVTPVRGGRAAPSPTELTLRLRSAVGRGALR